MLGKQAALPMSMARHAEWFHGSPHKLTVLRKGSTVTPVMELAMAFAHNPTDVSIETWTTRTGRRYRIKHNGNKDGYLYQVKVKQPTRDLEQHPESTLAPGEEMLTTRELVLELLEELPIQRNDR
jgi:hypothetical protein